MKKEIVWFGVLLLLCGICVMPNIVEHAVADPGWIDVSSPYGGEIWYKGQTYIIIWDSADAGSYVDIELYVEDYYYYTIASSTYNDGSYYWAIPGDQYESSYYQILVVSSSDSSTYDYSDDYFTILSISPTIAVTSPNGDESWNSGTSHYITWNSANAGDYVDIELYESGYYYSTIASSAYNDGSYYWTIPSGLSSSSYYEIKITSTSDSSIYDYSNYFSVTEPYLEWCGIIAIIFVIIVVVIIVAILSVKKGKIERIPEEKPRAEEELRLSKMKQKVKGWKKEGYEVEEIEQKIKSIEKKRIENSDKK